MGGKEISFFAQAVAIVQMLRGNHAHKVFLKGTVACAVIVYLMFSFRISKFLTGSKFQDLTYKFQKILTCCGQYFVQGLNVPKDDYNNYCNTTSSL